MAAGNYRPPFPDNLAGQNYKIASLGNPQETEHELILEYFYDQEKEDDISFRLLEGDSQRGVYARFMVVRSASSKNAHVLHTSSFIPAGVSHVEVKEKKKKPGFYKVCLKILKLKPSIELADYFRSKASLSSSDEEKT